ncbi:cell wall hydrolase [Mediterraneibacter catenae]|uniref:Cell wall hydrolase n=1 Tax=Mediterraneibacter catenae TaxID=2594882 RepID=A0A5M9HV41_9FIRM|nr:MULTISPECIES: cell wall hydrolase [Mediterraneibacter]KAA8500834.1 cell wall hydrolase [Mediterraneibacter catenae]MDM8124400.1 cell wall hydrolase [Mediterraneibacter glycyrrhizinilyticus]
MKYNQNRRIFRMFYAATASVTLLTGFTSLAAEKDAFTADTGLVQEEAEEGASWDFADTVTDIQEDAVDQTKAAAEEAKRLAEEKAAQEAAAQAEKEAQAQAEQAQVSSAVNASASEQELLAALIFCEAGNQPYDGQVAVGAVVMNRVRSGSFPDTITDVIYQSGQFTPAMTGWLDSVLASDGYTDSAMQAAADALAGSNPIGDCLYFSTGGGGYQLGDHYFR